MIVMSPKWLKTSRDAEHIALGGHFRFKKALLKGSLKGIDAAIQMAEIPKQGVAASDLKESQ